MVGIAALAGCSRKAPEGEKAKPGPKDRASWAYVDGELKKLRRKPCAAK
jgi:hypothetical protein